jgi:hypothetical protein
LPTPALRSSGRMAKKGFRPTWISCVDFLCQLTCS